MQRAYNRSFHFVSRRERGSRVNHPDFFVGRPSAHYMAPKDNRRQFAKRINPFPNFVPVTAMSSSIYSTED